MGAGYALDSVEPAIELMEKGNLDYICFECIGERTMAWAALDKMRDPSKGYNGMLDYRMDKVLDVYSKQGFTPKIISNMGVSNPIAAVERIAEMARRKGLSGLKICAVVGDDIFSRIEKYLDYPIMETGKPLNTLKEHLISANVYIGISGFVQALRDGADVVIAGRAADPSLVLAPAVYELGWKMDNWNLLGCGTIAGHLIECSSQITGGYYADPGHGKIVPELWKVGFPIAIVYENGDMEITKVEGSGGMVAVETVIEQLGYEVQDPARYLTPDCIADITGVTVEQIGKDRVLVRGGRGYKKTGTLKVNIGYRDCFIGEGQITYAGPTCLEKAKLAMEIVKKRLELSGAELMESRYEFIGVNSIFGDAISSEWMKAPPAEVRLRVAGRTKDRLNAQKIGWEVQTLPMNGPEGGGAHRSYVDEVLSIASILIDENEVNLNNQYVEI
jgi:hypothetical protein